MTIRKIIQKNLENIRNNFVSLKTEIIVIDDFDVTGLSVMDLFHNQENKDVYNDRLSDNFKDVVERILTDNNFEIAIKTVRTTNDNTTLRLKNVNTDYSSNFKDAIVKDSQPVVLSRGIHSNLLTWEKFAKDIASDPDNARDSWLIEMVGGPTIDEDCTPGGTYNCPAYTFSDLKTFYWPALIAGVERYSGQNTVDYVGYSMGCSAALESLELYGSSGKNDAGYYFDSDIGTYKLTDLAANPVDTFVAVACPNNMSNLPPIMKFLNYSEKNFNIINKLENSGKTHVNLNDIKQEVLNHYSVLKLIFPSEFNAIYYLPIRSNRMSTKIYDEIFNWMDNSTGPDIGKGVTVNNLMVVQGKITSDNFFSFLGTDSDMIAPNKDTREVCQNVDSSNKYYVSFDNKWHFFPGFNIPDSSKVQKAIKKFLSENKVSSEDVTNFNTNCGVI